MKTFFLLLSAVILCEVCSAGEPPVKAKDIQVRMRYQIALRAQDVYLLLPGNRIVLGLPRGGLDEFDVDKFCAATPENCGAYTLKDGQMSITWGGDGKRKPDSWKHVVLKSGEEEMGGAMWMKGVPFPAGHKLDGTYKWSASAGSGTSRAVNVAGNITFKPDGTFTRSSTGSVRATGGDTLGAVANNDQAGTYELNGYTLTLKPAQGEASKHTFMVQGTEKDLAKPGMVLYEGSTAFLTK